MQNQIEDFNWNLRHFLDVLSSYQTNVNKASPSTLQLLENTLDKIGSLIENVDEVDVGNSDAIIFSIDESKFDVRRSIFCRICNVSFGASRTEYMLHNADSKHHEKLIAQINKEKEAKHGLAPMDSNNNKNNRHNSTTKENEPPNLQKMLQGYRTDKAKPAEVNGNSILKVCGDGKHVADTKQTPAIPKEIPNVFGDNIFDFIESMGNKQSNNHSAEATATRTVSWREKSNEAPVEQWRQKNDVKTATAQPTSTATEPAKRTAPALVTKSIIQNGAILTGAGVKPSPTYDLNNLYINFPHLNPNKVPNPLKPAQDLKRHSNIGNGHGTKMSPGLQNLFDKSNREKTQNPRHSSNANHSNQMKKTELSNSLISLPAMLNTNSNLRHQNGLSANRMPGRSLTSINMIGKKSSPDNGQHRRLSNTANENKGDKARNIPTAPREEVKSKGAIPKQPAKNDSSKSNEQSKDLMAKNGTKNMDDFKESGAESDNEKLKKFFSGDLSSLISFIIDANSRSDKIVTHKKVSESIEGILKEKFKNVKCHLIGSHAYNIAKGGLATVDIYLDLYGTFYIDKSGQVFVTGMNQALKLIQESSDWTDVKCSEQTRYAIMSASYQTKTKCHFTFGHGASVRNTEVINTLFAAQPVARQLVICVRLALQERTDADWVKHFSGYVVALLVVFYLQINGKLPSIASLQSDPKLNIIKCGENMVHFKNPTNLPICKDRIRDLLIGFFKYYEHFDFDSKIISPFEGREINHNFRNSKPESLSRSLWRFKSLLETEPIRWNNKMCMQDIFEHKRNVTQSIQAKEIRAFKNFCTRAVAAMESVGGAVKY